MKVNIDFIPTLADVVSEEEGVHKLVAQINNALLKINMILKNLAIGINTIEFINGGIVENVWCDLVSVEFGVAGAELSATHSLGRIPIAIAGTKLAGSGGNIGFSQDATSTKLYLTSNVASLSGTILIV